MLLTDYILAPPLALSEVGGRTVNEDSVYPPIGSVSSADRLFIVCDGVGGASKGKEASQLVCRAISDYFRTHTGPSTHQVIEEAVATAESALDAYLIQQPSAKGMGTTMALVYLHEEGATVAHIGDSRVYQFRDGAVLFCTEDHKLVTDWVKCGLLTAEQAAIHPRRNVITRAVQGRSVQASVADVRQLTDLQPGDYFLLCTNGLLEVLTDDDLSAIICSKSIFRVFEVWAANKSV